MLVGLFIFVDDDFDDPVYSDVDGDDIEEEVWTAACEAVNEALEGDGPSTGTMTVSEQVIAWRTQVRIGLSFMGIAKSVKESDLSGYLNQVSKAYSYRATRC